MRSVSLTVLTDDDDTVDALLDYFGEFGKDDLKSVLASLPDSSTLSSGRVFASASDGVVVWC